MDRTVFLQRSGLPLVPSLCNITPYGKKIYYIIFSSTTTAASSTPTWFAACRCWWTRSTSWELRWGKISNSSNIYVIFLSNQLFFRWSLITTSSSAGSCWRRGRVWSRRSTRQGRLFLKAFIIIFKEFFGKNYSSLGTYVLYFSRRNKAHTNLRRFFCKFLGLVTIKNESHINIKESTFSSPTLVPSSPPCPPCGPTVASAPPSTGGRSSRWRTRCSTSSDN